MTCIHGVHGDPISRRTRGVKEPGLLRRPHVICFWICFAFLASTTISISRSILIDVYFVFTFLAPRGSAFLPDMNLFVFVGPMLSRFALDLVVNGFAFRLDVACVYYFIPSIPCFFPSCIPLDFYG